MKRNCQKNLKRQQLRSKTDGFVHIPKTGGTGIGEFFTRLSREIGPENVPTKFAHPWTVAEILEQFPEIRLHFIIRDPLERAVSGFLSRLRMGRPLHDHTWNLDEAATFSFFAEPQQLLRGLMSDDERTKSAALFGYENVPHLKRNYIYYFQSVEYISGIMNNIGSVRRIDRTAEFLQDMIAVIGADPEAIDRHYSKTHVSQVSARGIVSQMDDSEVARVKDALKREYDIYHCLQDIADTRTKS